MADISFKDVNAAISTADEISAQAKEFIPVQSGLDQIRSDLARDWQSTGIDQQSSYAVLQKAIVNMGNVSRAIIALANVIKNYAQNIGIISSSTIELGSKVGNYNYSYGYDSVREAYSDTNKETLKTEYFDETTEFNRFGVVEKDGSVTLITEEGTSIQDLLDKGYTTDQIVVEVAKNGTSMAFIPSKDFLDSANWNNTGASTTTGGTTGTTTGGTTGTTTGGTTGTTTGGTIGTGVVNPPVGISGEEHAGEPITVTN